MASKRYTGTMAAHNADRVTRQAFASLPSVTLTEFLSVLDVDLTNATAKDRAHVLHTMALIEDARDLARYQEAVRAAFADREGQDA